jgi:hypothetical protein
MARGELSGCSRRRSLGGTGESTPAQVKRVLENRRDTSHSPPAARAAFRHARRYRVGCYSQRRRSRLSTLTAATGSSLTVGFWRRATTSSRKALRATGNSPKGALGVARARGFTLERTAVRSPDDARRTRRPRAASEMNYRDEALAELMRHCFASRGPATWEDFLRWASLTPGDSTGGLEMIRPELKWASVDPCKPCGRSERRVDRGTMGRRRSLSPVEPLKQCRFRQAWLPVRS